MTGTRMSGWHIAVAASFLSLFLLAGGVAGYWSLQDEKTSLAVDEDVLQAWQKRIQRQEQQVHQTREQANAQLQVLTQRVAELQAELYQLQGLSQRLAEVAEVDLQQFMNELQTVAPYAGGEGGVFQEMITLAPYDFMETLDRIGAQLSERAGQLMLLEKLLSRRGISDGIMGVGRVVDKGWISSAYGYRKDPFTARVTMHKGIDISGPHGTGVRSLAPGIVRFSGKNGGYGNMVEIDHGNDFVTRYGHNHHNLVSVGDIVGKGQVIAQMGSTGRSTGSHVHFEVLRNNENLNPLAYIQAAASR